MTKKILVFSGLILTLTTIWNFGFLNQYNYFSAKSDIRHNTLKKIIIGELMILPMKMNEVSSKYGFTNIALGCSISQTELNGIKIYNSEIDKHLIKKNGINWKVKYNNEIDSLRALK